MSDGASTYGEVIREHRGPRSRHSVALALGRTEGAVRQWETGTTRPPYDVARQLDELLGAGAIMRALGYETADTLAEIRAELAEIRARLDVLEARDEALANVTQLPARRAPESRPLGRAARGEGIDDGPRKSKPSPPAEQEDY